jgi:hypothetical protein
VSVRGMWFVAVILLLLGLAQAASAQVFFDSTKSYRQAVQLMGETEVVLGSSLSDADVVIQRGNAADVTLDITARYSIAGYHGSRENAGASELYGPELAFRISRRPGRLILESGMDPHSSRLVDPTAHNNLTRGYGAETSSALI